MTTFEPAEKVLPMDGLDFVEHVVDRKAIADPLLASAVVPGSLLFEQFLVLRTKVKAIAAEKPFRCIGILSAIADEGNTTVAFGLALSLAEERRRVLLVEATLRDPVISSSLGLVPNGGLSNWLRTDVRPVSVRRIDPWGLRVLPGGGRVSSPAELLGSDRMARLLEVARRAFDYVIVDCPPLVPVADSLVLQELLDGALLVVRARHGFRETILTAHRHLKPNLVQGIVFNDQREIFTRRLGRHNGLRQQR